MPRLVFLPKHCDGWPTLFVASVVLAGMLSLVWLFYSLGVL